MKKIVLALLLLTAVTTVAIADDNSAGPGIYIKPSAALDFGIGNYFRGGAFGGTVMFSTGGLWIGAEVIGDIDAGYNIVNFPIFLDIGLGHGFWIMVGQTFAPADPYLRTGNAQVIMKYANFPNTFGLGAAPIGLDLGGTWLRFYSELTYTIIATKSASAADDQLVESTYVLPNILLGLKLYIGVSLELKVL